MLAIILSIVVSGVSFALLAWGATIRDTMAREGMEHGAGLMPAGATTEVG